MLPRRLLEVGALLMIGEGAMALLFPERYLALWEIGPERFRALMEDLERRPGLTRAIGAAELGVGLWLAASLLPGRR